MKFLIKEISPSRKELRVTLNSIDNNGLSYYIFGSIGKNFDEGSIKSKYIPPVVSNYYSLGPNPGIIRLIVAYLKDMLGTPEGFQNTVLVTHTNQTVPIINIAIDDISLINLTSATIPSLVIKLIEPLPSSSDKFNEVVIQKQIISTQEQEVYYISATEPPAVIRGLEYDEGLKEKIGNAELQKTKYESMSELTASFKHEDDTIIKDIISGSDTNLKIDFNNFENHVHFGSAVSKLDNFTEKLKNIENYLTQISQSLSTGSLDSANLFRKNSFGNIQNIKSGFTQFEKTLYYKSDTLLYPYNINIGANYAAINPINSTQSTTLLNQDGFNRVHYASGSETGSMELFRGKYNVEDKPFYNHSGSFYLSFLMRGDEILNGPLGASAGDITQSIRWTNYQKQNIPMLPSATLYTSSILQPNILSESWQRYVYLASSSYWAPFADNPIIGAAGTITDFDTTDEITLIHTPHKTGSHSIKAGGRYSNLATTVTSSGVFFTGSIAPAGELFRIWTDTVGQNISSSYITDIKLTKYDPQNIMPFSEVYRTGSAEFQSWYGDMYASASEYDSQNPHSLIKTLPGYFETDGIGDNSQLRSFANMMGENFDNIKNYIDNYSTIFRTQYGEVGTVPDNLLPVIAQSYNWEFKLPFGNPEDANLGNMLGSSLSNINTTGNVKNNIWRNIINNINYIYKTKGTKNSIRALLNSYGFPPDIMKIREAGASMDQAENAALSSDVAPSLDGLGGASGNTSFTTKQSNMVMYVIDTFKRQIGLEWSRDSVTADVLEFIIKPTKGTQTQEIIRSSGSAGKVLWDVTLEPSGSDDSRSRLHFRINNTVDGVDAIETATNTISMSTDYHNFKNQNYWNVLIQRTEGASGSYSNILETDIYTTSSYEMYIGEQKLDKLRVLEKVSMSYGGTHHSASSANWLGTGSRATGTDGNLVVGEIYTGSIAEIRSWKYPLSASAFKQHVYDKKSMVGNGSTDAQTNLIYQFKLNENWISGSNNPKFKDANPQNVKDYTIQFSDILTGSLGESPMYDTDLFDRIQFSVGIGGAYEMSDNSIIIDNERRFIDNLNPFQPSVMSVYHPLLNKRKASSVLEITRSPQEVINDFILNQLGSFDFNDLFADPQDIVKTEYKDLEDFAKNFFDYYEVSIDINKFIRAQAAIFTEDLITSLKRLVPARAAFSKIGVEIKPTFFYRQKLIPPKIEHQILSFEGSIAFNDWEKSVWSFRKLHILEPALLTYDGDIELASATGSSQGYYDYTNQYELYQTKDADIEVASPTGSSQGYYDYTNQYELYQTKDMDFNIASSTGSIVRDFVNYIPLYESRDMGFDIASSTGSITWNFDKNETLYQYRDADFLIASATGSIAKDFTKYEPLYQTKDFSFDVASSTGSITKDFTKSEPLYQTRDADFLIASATGSIAKDFTKYEPLYQTKDVDFLIASATGSITKDFTKSEPLYQTKDVDFLMASHTGSIAWNFANNELLYQSNDFDLWSTNEHFKYHPKRAWKPGKCCDDNDYGYIHFYVENGQDDYNYVDFSVSSATGSISWDFTKNESLYDVKEFTLFSTDNIKNHPKQSWKPGKCCDGNDNNYIHFYVENGQDDYKYVDFSVSSATGSISWNFTTNELLYQNKDLDLFSVEDDIDKPDSAFHFTDIYELYKTIDSHIELASPTGSSQGYYDYTNQYEYIENKNLDELYNIPNIVKSGSDVIDFSNQMYDYKNLNLINIGNYFTSESKNIKFYNDVYDYKDLDYFNIHNYFSTNSKYLRFDNNIYQYKDLDYFNIHNYFTTSSKYLRFDNKIEENNDLHLFDIHDYYTTSSKYMKFNNSVYQYLNSDIEVASATGSNPDFTKYEDLYLTRDTTLDLNATPKDNNSNSTSSIEIESVQYEYRDQDIEIASATSSKPTISSEIFLPHEGTFNLIGNTTFYEHAFKSFSDLSDKWGTGSNDVQFIHFGYAGKYGDYNTYHYEKRYIFHAIGDVESISGSNSSMSSSFETDFTGNIFSSSGEFVPYTASKDFSNQRFIKTGQFLGERPLGTTMEFKPTGSISFKGGKFFDKTFIYPANHIFIVGTSKDSINRLIYKGTQNLGGDVIESEAFTDLDERAYYHVLTTGGEGYTITGN